MIDPYFATVNLKFPIWDKSKFQAMVDSLRQDSTCPESRWAGNVCCNSLVLFTLHADSVRSVRRKMAQSGVTKSVSSLDSDLVAGFLANSKHAQCCRKPRTALSVPSQRTGALVTGVPPRIPARVQLNFAAQDTDKAFEALSLQAELAETEDIIYRNLYAPDRVSNRRRDWLAKSNVDMDTAKSQPKYYPAQAALVFQALSAISALMSAHREQPDAIFQ
ncbi:hypothetical protein E4U11_003032 [Claviceps purpurea]|nr:hypothetical protein E4U11_003032 [Claviceps purpurea]